MKIAIYGANGRSVALAGRDLKKGTKVGVFFDRDPKRIGGKIKKGIYGLDGDRVFCDFDGIVIDTPENHGKYDFEYIVVFAGSINTNLQKEIVSDLIKLGVAPEKIICYSRQIFSGVIYTGRLGDTDCSFGRQISSFEQNGISGEKYLDYAEDLLKAGKDLFSNRFRIFILECFVEAIRASVKGNVIDFYGVRMDRSAFADNPSLFMYECADIFIDAYPEEMDRVEYIEGPYLLPGVDLDEEDIVIDAGANCGMFSAMAASKIPKGRIYAFEPVSQEFEILERTADLYDNIIPVRSALAEKSGKSRIDMTWYDGNQGAASMMRAENSARTQEIDVITLDEYVEKAGLDRVNFIKADIEGAERLMLLGAKKTIKKYAPRLSICTYHYPEDPALLGFLIKQINPDYIIEYAYQKLYAHVEKK